MGYADLYEQLLPECSEVDRVVKYILDLNILVRYLNVEHCYRAGFKKIKDDLKAECPNFKYLRFTPGPRGDEAKIHKRWKQLVKDSGITNPQLCLQNFRNSKMVRLK